MIFPISLRVAAIVSLSFANPLRAVPFADASRVEAFTGGRTKVVWVEDVVANKDAFGEGSSLVLRGWDSKDSGRVVDLVKDPQSIFRPLIAPDGGSVIFTDRTGPSTWRVDWDGGGVVKLRDAFGAAEVWRDPATGRTWVYGQTSVDDHATPVLRFPIDDPAAVEPVWGEVQVESLPVGNFQLSRSGRWAAAAFPWPECGWVDLANGEWTKQTSGCWPSMAPDESGVMWTFDGAHQNLLFHHIPSGRKWSVRVSNAPGVDDFEVYHPRWSNAADVFVLTGPYATGDREVRISDGGEGVEILLGKLSPDAARVADWLVLTSGGRGEFFPDVWVEGGESRDLAPHPGPADAQTAPPADVWPVPADGVVFAWRDNFSAGAFRRADGRMTTTRLSPFGSARFGPNGEMRLFNGVFTAEESAANDAAVALGSPAGWTIEALVTPGMTTVSPRGAILTLADSDKNLVRIAQDGPNVVLILGKQKPIALGALTVDRPAHIQVVFDRGTLRYYRNGELTSEHRVKGPPAATGGASLVFGGDASARWTGWLGHVVVRDRALPPGEVQAGWRVVEAKLAQRQHVVRRRVDAEVVSVSTPPDPASIAPYRRALALHTYRITDPNRPPEDVRVVEWVLLDGAVPGSIANLRVGDRVHLQLEPFDAHPQLESERFVGEPPPLDEPVFYNILSGW